MNNEQRAHDFAIMLTSFYLNNPQKAGGEIPELYQSETVTDKELFDNPFAIYQTIYNRTLPKFCNK